MHVPLTLAALALLTLGLVLLRIRWPYLAPRTHRCLIVLAGIALAFSCLNSVSHWQPIWQPIDAAQHWTTFAAYEFLVLLLTLLRPRLLTSIIAAVLILPILSASTLLPLTALFDHPVQTTVPLAPNVVTLTTIVKRTPYATNAADFEVFYRPSWLPFLQHRLASTRFFDTQCNSPAAYATLQPDQRVVLLTCPPRPGQSSDATIVERHSIHIP